MCKIYQIYYIEIVKFILKRETLTVIFKQKLAIFTNIGYPDALNNAPLLCL